VRVYVEGFRVLPYGDEGNDWLTLDSDYTRRSPPQYAAEVEAIVGAIDEDKKWKNMILSNRSYFGAVFITQEDAGELTPLINREGFLPNAAYFRLREWVRIGIDLFVRVRAAVEYQEREAKKAKRKKHPQVRGSTVLAALAEATTATRSLRLAATTGDTDAIASGAEGLNSRLTTLKESLEEFVSETDILRVTASVGTQMGEFVHEVQSLLGTTEAVTEAIGRLRIDKAIPATKRAELAIVYGNVSDMRKQLERQASYLLDIATADASRRRSKQRLADRFDRALKLVERAAEKRGIEIRNAIPPDLVSPKMFPAELTTVFANLLSNAVKNAGDDGVIQAIAQTTRQGVVLKVQNTGNRVDVDNSERLFLPYVSTTTSVDTTLGQGMGLGLTITRKTLEEYGATICFVPPAKQFQTAVQIVFPSEE
jgi:signal transduction histidine kinase